MKVVWDEPKRQANLNKHGFDVGELDWRSAVMELAKPDKIGQPRLKAIGYFRDGSAVVVFAQLGTEAISLISFRKANAKERSKLRWPRS